jgi:succinate dehydrogenase / fumarate reductase, cytochrome b subunit
MCFEMLSSSVGRKYAMAVTGILLSLFVVAHLLGNLQIFLGPEALNAYSEHLAGLPMFLWPARVILFLTLALHIRIAVSLALENKKARPIPYGVRNTVQASYASRTMMISGPLVSAFIVYHLLHFTFGVTHPEYFRLTDAEGRKDVYSMVVFSFRDWRVATSYMAAMALLAFHLSHGFSSLFQSLGFNNDAWNRRLKIGGAFAALLIFLGFSSIPLASLLGALP